MDLFSEIKKLNFSSNKYIVVGGAAMAARNIKETCDIDIVVTPDLFEHCKQEGWQEHLRPNGGPGLKKGMIEVYLDVNSGNFNPSFEELRNRAQIIDEIPFCSLEDVRRFKKEYNRDKDIKDINLIDNYLQSHL